MRTVMQNKKIPTMKYVAGRANVSTASVSRVINNDPSVNPQLRQVVEEAIQILGYEPKTSHQLNRMLNVGLFIPDIANPYFSLLIKGITSVGRILDISIILGNADLDPTAEQNYIDHFLALGVDGLITIPFTEAPNPVLRELIDADFPLIFFDREYHLEHINSVASNNEEGVHKATTYLLNLGHGDIILISGPLHYSTTSITRLNGYKQCLIEVGMEFKEDMVLQGDTSLESGYRLTLDLLRSGKFFTALFASNDTMAYGVWKALEEKGYVVPEEISLLVYDDIHFSSYISLTTIAQPGFEIGFEIGCYD